jgi:hypothetical protein
VSVIPPSTKCQSISVLSRGLEEKCSDTRSGFQVGFGPNYIGHFIESPSTRIVVPKAKSEARLRSRVCQERSA